MALTYQPPIPAELVRRRPHQTPTPAAIRTCTPTAPEPRLRGTVAPVHGQLVFLVQPVDIALRTLVGRKA